MMAGCFLVVVALCLAVMVGCIVASVRDQARLARRLTHGPDAPRLLPALVRAEVFR